MLQVDDGEDTGDRLADVVDLGELGARRSDLLDAELVQLSLELVELLEELILILAPEGSGLDFAGGLFSRQKVSIGS